MATTQKWSRGTADTILTTELNSLANNTNVIKSTAIQPTSTEYTMVEVELYVTFGSAPTANTAVSIWFLREIDGTNYEDGSSSITPTRNPDVVFGVRSTTNPQRMIKTCILPPGDFKPLLRNEGTGQAFASSGNVVKIRPVTLQSV